MSTPVDEQLRQAIVAIRGLKEKVATLQAERSPPIAIVGMACRLPGGASDPATFWKVLRAGEDAIVEVPASRWDAEAWFDANPDTPGRMNTRHGGFVPDLDRFDAAFFGLSSREAAGMDPQQRALLETAWHALEDAAISPDALAGTPTGVFLGINGSDFHHRALADTLNIDAHALSGSVASVAAGRIAYLLGLQGPAVAVDTACSSSLTAVHQAVASLRARETRVALAGGVQALLSPLLGVALTKLRMLAPDGRCKTFDATADGFGAGEGCALVVLKRLADAEADGDRVIAVLRGSATNQDGRSSSLTAPSRAAQAAVIRAALADAGIEPSRVGYVETHGTGTALGDPIEVRAIADALGRNRPSPVALGAVKSAIGHLGPAAGIAGLVKAALVVRHGEIPPNVHLTTLNPEILDEAAGFLFPNAPTPWPLAGPRVAGVSSFGFAGTNVHVVLEEAPAAAAANTFSGPLVITVSARTESALATARSQLLATLEADADLAAVARTTLLGRRAFEWRVAIPARTVAEARERLADAPAVRVPARPRLALVGAPSLNATSAAARALATLRAQGLVVAFIDERLDASLAPEATPRAPERFAAEGATAVLDLSSAEGSERRLGTDLPRLVLVDDTPESTASCLAALHAHGFGIRWAERLGPGPRATLPGYPFERRAYGRWAPPAPPSVAPASPAEAAPPGEVVPSSDSSALFRLPVSLEIFPWLGDHRVHGRVVVPGAFQLACLHGAWRARHDGPFEVQGLVFGSPFVLPAAGHRVAWTRLAPDGSATLESSAGHDTLRHATARLRIATPASTSPIDVPALRTRLGEAISPGQWRDRLRGLGIDIGPAFAGIRELFVGPGEAFARVELTVSDTGGWHPACLDACLQAAGAALPEATREGEALLPVGIDRVVLHAPPTGPLWVHATGGGQDGTWVTSLTIADEAGRTLATVEGLHVRRAPVGQLNAGSAPDAWTVAWEAAPPREGEHGTPRRRLFLVAAESADAIATIAGGDDVIALAANETRQDADGRWRCAESGLTDLLDAIGAVDEIIDVRGLAPTATHSPLDALRALHATLAAVCARQDAPRYRLVTRGAVDETPNPFAAAAWGLAATAALEHPALGFQRLDVDADASLARELARNDNEPAVSWRDGKRRVARLQPRPVPRAAAPVQLRETVLITGGLGAIGRHLARWAAERGAGALLLVGRRPPDADAQSFLATLGVPATCLALDVAAPNAQARLREALKSLPPLRTVLHAAGAQHPGLLADLPWDAIAGALGGKLLGAWHLHTLTSEMPLDHFVLFSSLAGTLGAAGQGGYAAANAGLDALARHRRSLGLPGLSLAWGRWAGDGMAAELNDAARRRVDALGIEPLDPALALAALEGALAEGGTTDCVLAAADWRRYESRLGLGPLPLLTRVTPSPRTTLGDTPTRTTSNVPDWHALAEAQREPALCDYLARRLAAILGDAHGPVDVDRPVIQLGLDSLLAMELRNALQRELGFSPALADWLGGATVREMASQLAPTLAAVPAQAPAPTASASATESGAEFPLTDIQQAYWFGRRSLALGNVACHAYREFLAQGVDLTRLERAWQQLIERHGMLRAVISDEGQQRVLPTVPPYRFAVRDLRGDPNAAQVLAAMREALSHRCADPSVWPLFDIRVTLCDDGPHLHVGMDLLIADAASMVQLYREWEALYHDPGAALPALANRFENFVRTPRASPEALARSAAYWQARLPDLPGPPELPRQEPVVASPPRFSRHARTLDAATWSALRARARAAGLTPATLLCATYADVLAKWSRHPRFLVTLTTFPAPAEFRGVVGDFTDTLLLEVDARDATFLGRARALQSRLAQDLDHAGWSGVRVARELARARQRVADAIPVVFTSALGAAGDAGSSLPLAWLGRDLAAITQTPQVWIDHHVIEDGDRLHVSWDAQEALFPPGLVATMFQAQVDFLTALAQEDRAWDAPLGRHLPAAQAERRHRANDTAAPRPAGFLHDGFFAWAAREPQRPALVTRSATWTYGQLAERAAAVARRVREAGVGRNQLVGIAAPKGPTQLAAALGIVAAGAAYLPIDPALPAARRRHLATHGEIALVLIDEDGPQDWPEGVAAVTVASLPVGGRALPPMLPGASPSDLAYVLYTSGSTGEPKGVMIEHGAALNTVADVNRRFGIGADDAVLALSSLSFDLSVHDLFGLLGVGGRVVIPDAERLRDPAHWHELMMRAGVTVWNSVPALLSMLVEHGEPLDDRLRVVMLSGDWIPLPLPARIKALAPGATVYSLGGATEASIWSNWFEVRRIEPGWRSIPYGWPLANQRYHVLDDTGEPAPEGVPGKLHIAGDGLARGYWRDAARTAERFLTHPRTGERLYDTGDIGRYLEDGSLEFLGREDAQVKVRGHRIELGEIESRLREHPEVKSAVVLATGEPRGERQLVAWVVPAANDRAQRAAFLLSRVAVRAAEDDAARHALPADGLPVGAAARSTRRFLPSHVPLASLGGLLSCLRTEALGGSLRYPYPSAGSTYAVQTWVRVSEGRVAGLPGGLYYHHPDRHDLERVGDDVPGHPGANDPANHAIWAGAAFTIFLVADLDAVAPLYGERARDFCLIEAGHMGQRLSEQALPRGLGLCAMGIADEAWPAAPLALGERRRLLHAFVGGVPDTAAFVPTPAAPAPAAGDLATRLTAWCAETLPDYMVPAAVVTLDALPLTPNGKVDRARLPAPRAAAPRSRSAAPESALEASVASVFAEVLGLESVGRDEALFDLGGTSVHVVRIHRRLERQLSRTLDIVDVFRHPTVRALAAHLGGDAEGPASSDEGAARGRARRQRARTASGTAPEEAA